MNVQFVPQKKYDEIWGQLPDMQFHEKQRVSQSFWYQNQEFVVTAGMSSLHKVGWIEAHRIEDLKAYKGVLKPLSRSEHLHEINLGNRDRSYQGQTATYKGRIIVFCEKLTFKLAQVSPQQLSIF